MPTYCTYNYRLSEKFRAIARHMNRRFKELEQEDLLPVTVRIEE